MRSLSSLISPSVNTSLPKRKGMRRNSTFVNSTLPIVSSFTFFISSRAPLEPMSIAAKFLFSISY